MCALLSDYVNEFVGMVNIHLLQGKGDRIDEGRAEFDAFPLSQRANAMLCSRAPLRIAIGVRDQPQLIPNVFHPESDDPVVLFLTADMLHRLPPALDRLQPPAPPRGTTALNSVAVMRLLHTLMEIASESQTAEFLS